MTILVDAASRQRTMCRVSTPPVACPGPSGPHIVRRVGQDGSSSRPSRRRRPVTVLVPAEPVGCQARAVVRTELGYLALAGLLAFLVVLGFAGFSLAVAPSVAPVPSTTTVVRVDGGESLWDIAERAAPGSDPASVVRRIQELNDLAGSLVFPGQPLLVPSER